MWSVIGNARSNFRIIDFCNLKVTKKQLKASLMKMMFCNLWSGWKNLSGIWFSNSYKLHFKGAVKRVNFVTVKNGGVIKIWNFYFYLMSGNSKKLTKNCEKPLKVFKKQIKKSFSIKISKFLCKLLNITHANIICKALVAICRMLKKFDHQDIYENFWFFGSKNNTKILHI